MIIGFSTPKTWHVLPELIKWWDAFLSGERFAASHSYTRFKSLSWERDFIYQAKGLRTNFVSGHYFTKDNIVIEEYEIDLPEETEIKIGQTCVDREGTPYAIKQVIGQIYVNLIFVLTFKKVKLKNPAADGQGAVSCLEEMGYLIADGLGIKVDVDLEGISIKEFRDWFKGLPGVRKLETDTKTI